MASDTFAIYHTWPEMRNAEYEVLQRVLGAAKRIGKRAVVIDNGGTILWAHPETQLRAGRALLADDVEFAISLHMESPRVCDVYTYYALWQPVEFYADFGYQECVDKFSTHNDLLSCHSDIADRHALNIFSGMGRNVASPLPSLFHMLPEPFLEPRITRDSSLFYVGINWERIGRAKGRFHDTLMKLDAQKLVKIYGPELIQGVATWEGFQTYSGELPFDGSSMLTAINECGVCLALSSKAHQNSGIMSNRLFEGLAGGAAVIANPNAIIDKYFSDVVYVVDDTRGESYLQQQIVSCLRQIRSDPDAAMERVLKGQEILRQVCSIERSLQHLFDATPSRKMHQYRDFPPDTAVAVVLVAADASVEEITSKLRDLAEQFLCTISLHIIVAPDVADCLTVEPHGSLAEICLHSFDRDRAPDKFDDPKRQPVALGKLIGEILFNIEQPYFSLMQMSDMVMRDHFTRLVRAMNREPGAHCAISGTLLRTIDVTGREQRNLDALRVEKITEFLTAEGSLHAGRALFRANLIDARYQPLLNLLDGHEHHLFLVAALIEGPLAQTNFASHLHDEAAPVSIHVPALSSDVQRQFIRDHFKGNSNWLAKLEQEGRRLTLNPTSDPLSHRRWITIHTQAGKSKRLEPNRIVAIKAGEIGTDFLSSGFSFPEEDGVWLAADKGVIEFSLPLEAASHAEDYNVVIGMCGRRNESTGRMQHCTFTVNNVAVAYHAIPDFYTNVSVKIPLNIMRATNRVRLELLPDYADMVHDDAGNVIDHRRLSLKINSISIVRDTDYGVFVLAPNTIHALAEGNPATRSLVAGFYAPERHATWMCGMAGEIQVRLRDAMVEPILHLRMAGRIANHDGAPQTAMILVNGVEVGRALLTPEPQNFRFPIDMGAPSEIVTIALHASHAEPVIDSSGTIVDPRLIGLSVFELGILEKNRAGPIVRNSSRKPSGLGAMLQRMWKGR